MKQPLIFVFLSLISAQTLTIPYDWSGQFGIRSDDGEIFWNRDWTAGPLFFDGSFNHYPRRFGAYINDQFRAYDLANIPNPAKSYADSAQTQTKLDYGRGDYNEDQLGIDLDTYTPSRKNSGRHSGIHLFKRSYAGREGQFFHPRGSAAPLQQSYVLDYHTQQNDHRTAFAAGRFVTASGLPDSGLTNGLLEDEILTAGLITSAPVNTWRWTSQIAVFQQQRQSTATWIANQNRRHLNRSVIRQHISGFSWGDISPEFGLEWNAQSYSKDDSSYFKRTWMTAHGSAWLWGVQTQVGVTNLADKIYPVYALNYKHDFGNFTVQGAVDHHTAPAHMSLQSTGHEVMEYDHVYFQAGLHIKKLDIYLKSGRSELQWFDNPYPLYFIGFNYHGQLSRSLGLNGHAFWREGSAYLFDGLGTTLLVNADYVRPFDRFALRLNFSVQGLLDRKGELQFNALESYPTENFLFSNGSENIWLLNASAAVTISSMTITWSVNNILQAVEPLALQLFPDKTAGDFLIQFNDRFPPMGRLISLGILWTFND